MTYSSQEEQDHYEGAAEQSVPIPTKVKCREKNEKRKGIPDIPLSDKGISAEIEHIYK